MILELSEDYETCFSRQLVAEGTYPVQALIKLFEEI